MKYYISLLMFICFANFSNSQNDFYNTKWAEVEKLQNEGLTKSASDVVNSIFVRAKKDENTIEITKALLHQSKYLQILEEEAQLTIVNNFKNEIETSDTVTKRLLENMLATIYWQYYQQNRYKFYNRTKTEAKVSDDFRTWDLETLFAEIHTYYQASLQNGLLLQQEELSAYNELLTLSINSKTYRPTLFDLLNHNALEFYKTDENSITQPSYQFKIDNTDFIAESETFINLNISSKDTVNLQLNASKIYQNLLKFHRKDKTSKAFVALNIERLNFVKQNATFSTSSDDLIKTLKSESNAIKDNATSGLYQFEIANQLVEQGNTFSPENDMADNKENNRWKLKEAIAICDAVIGQFPDSDAMKKCVILKQNILQPQLSLRAERFLPINKPSLILVTYKNLTALDFSIYKVKKSEIDAFNQIYNADDKSKFISKLNPFKTFESVLKNENDYQNHSTEIIFPDLGNGLYLIKAQTKANQDVFATADIQVTDLALVESNDNTKNTYQIINRTNGKPITNAKTEVTYSENRNNNRYRKSFTTDSNGKFVFKKDTNSYHSVEITVNYNDDTAIFGNSYINRIYKQQQNTSSIYNTYVFTDRSIYRPSQTVYFKGIVTETVKSKTTVYTGKTVTATLHNVNGEEISKLNFTTSEYGSFNGEFILPNDGLTGNFYIKVNGISVRDSYHYFTVEEYKRPKFETTFKAVTETYKVNDSITVNGNALAYAGSTITDAKVVYRVKRNVQFPSWFYWRRPYFNIEAQEITFGESKTNAKGEFEITFKAIPDESTSKENLPVFSYEVTADVTDINGETRSATTTVRVGYHALIATINAPQRIDKDEKETEIVISTTNLNGEFVPAKGKLKIYKLQAPDAVLRTRPWQAPDYQSLSETEFKALFPNEAYKNESDIRNWEKGAMVLESDFDTKNSKSVILKRLKNWTSGSYIITLESTDKFGQAVKDESYTTLFNNDDKGLADNKLFDISLDKASYEIGETAMLTFGTSAKDLYITLEIEKNNAIVDTQIHKLSDSKKSISLPITDGDLGGYVVHYSFSAFNGFTSGSLRINVPYPTTDLQIETSSFRNKLQPGQDETWSFKIKGPKGDKVASEVLASMYDASLDTFKPHNWAFSPINSPVYYGRINKNTNLSFGITNFRLNNYFFGAQSYPYQGFDQFNWFGFYFGNNLMIRGYSSIDMKSRNVVSAVMDDSESLDEVVATGAPNVDLVQTLTGQISDLNISTSSGKPGNRTLVQLRGVSSINGNTEPLFIVDGLEVSQETFRSIKADEILDIKILKTPEQLSKYGKKGENGVILITTKSNENLSKVKIRKNLQETAFFFPDLKTDKDGNLSFSFKAPEALTKWKLQLLAHTKTLESTVAQFETVTQKELMVIPNAPRFLREGDEITISTKIANLTENQLSGLAQLVLSDAVTGNNISKTLLTATNLEAQEFTVDTSGNTQVSWTLSIPKGLQAVEYKIIAKAGAFSDGEQNALPVLTNRMLVTETMPMWIRSNETKTFTLDKLASNNSSTLRNHKLTLEITSNPAWYAVQALPYLMEYPYDCNEQTFSRYYANALAQHIVKSNPKIEAVFNQWKSQDALLSNLEKNQELKSLLIQETPWLRDVQSESEQKKRIALLFDLNKMNNELQSSLRKLSTNQYASGAWPWFNGGRENRYITQHIVSGFGHLKKLNVTSTDFNVQNDMIEKAISYLDKQFINEYNDLKKYDKNRDLSKDHLSYTQLHYLYVRSFYPEIKLSKEAQRITDYYTSQIESYWLSRSLYAKGLMALTMNRLDESATATKILKSLNENSITSEELGMYWKENTNSWYWQQAPIETQALLIEAFSEIENNTDTIDNLKIWLLKNKQTNQWKTTKATTEAVYALLLQGSDWLDVTESVAVTVGNEIIDPLKLDNVKVEAGTGYYKTSWNGSEIKPEQAKVTMTKKGEGIAWGALYWQYFEDLDKITSAETPLKLSKKLFLKSNTDRGESLSEITSETKLKVGDLVRVRIDLSTDRDMEFVHLKDMRAAGFEPVNVLSQYKWQDGFGYYESTKDAATNFFIDFLPKGIYVFEYDVRVNNAGNMSNGISTIQSMYAPEFSSYSEGIRVKIEN